MFHKVVQVYPTDDYEVYIYFADGKVKLYDARELIRKGVFNMCFNYVKMMCNCIFKREFLYERANAVSLNNGGKYV